MHKLIVTVLLGTFFLIFIFSVYIFIFSNNINNNSNFICFCNFYAFVSFYMYFYIVPFSFNLYITFRFSNFSTYISVTVVAKFFIKFWYFILFQLYFSQQK